jgi:Tol biopolymer transport system component
MGMTWAGALPALIGGVAVLWLGTPRTIAQQAGWSTPTNLGEVVNSVSIEQHPALSPDGLSLYFSSDRPGGAGGTDLWVTRRSSEGSPWQAPRPVATLNSEASEFAPAFDPTGHWMFFGSERSGGCGGRDIWISRRGDLKDDQAWKPPVNLGCDTLSWPGFDDGPTYFRDGRFSVLFFISDRPGGLGARDVWSASHRDGGPFTAPTNVAELNSAADDARPAVRADGLELFVTSQRVGSVLSGVTPSSDIWVARRTSPAVAFGAPANVTELNTSAVEAAPTLSVSGKAMIFHSNRPGGQGGLDLWTSTRGTVNQP